MERKLSTREIQTTLKYGFESKGKSEGALIRHYGVNEVVFKKDTQKEDWDSEEILRSKVENIVGFL